MFISGGGKITFPVIVIKAVSGKLFFPLTFEKQISLYALHALDWPAGRYSPYLRLLHSLGYY
jgi:hypothetical protein